jgi:hypothetical protein
LRISYSPPALQFLTNFSCLLLLNRKKAFP